MRKKRNFRSLVGLRTLKTALAVSLSIVLVEQYGTSIDELIFAVMGAFSAMEPTVKKAFRSCAAQFSGVAIGVLLAILIRMAELSGVVSAGVGIILIMAVYQLFRWKSSPVLPCLILVTICTKPELGAVAYGLERIWNTMIGMGTGMAINMLIFPYDNSKKIQQSLLSLDDDLIRFLEDMFDGDEYLPATDDMTQKMVLLDQQVELYADQRLLRRRRQKRMLKRLKSCEDTAQELVTEVLALRMINHSGRLNQENKISLRKLGADIPEAGMNNRFNVEDLVINYHVKRVLELREQLRKELSEQNKKTGE